MKRRAGTPWGDVVVDDSIKHIPRYLQYVQRDVWQGYAGFMHLTDMSTSHLKNLLSFLEDRKREVLAQARSGLLHQLLTEPILNPYDDRAYDVYIDTFDDVPLVQELRRLIAKRERERTPSVEEAALQRHIAWLDGEVATLVESRARAEQRLREMREAG